MWNSKCGCQMHCQKQFTRLIWIIHDSALGLKVWFVKKHEQLTRNTKLKIGFKKLHLKIFYLGRTQFLKRGINSKWPLILSRLLYLVHCISFIVSRLLYLVYWNSFFELFQAIHLVPRFMFLTVNVKKYLKKVSPTLFISLEKEPTCFHFPFNVFSK